MGAPKGHKPYNKKGEGGAPKIHNDDFIEKEADAFLEWMKKPSNFYFKNFALERGYHPQRLTEFAEKNKRFSESLKMAQALQASKLVQGGLSSTFNPGFTKFILVNAHSQEFKSENQEEPNKFTGNVNVTIDRDRVKEPEED